MENQIGSELDELKRCYETIAKLNSRIKQLTQYLDKEMAWQESISKELSFYKRRNRKLEKLLGIYNKYKGNYVR